MSQRPVRISASQVDSMMQQKRVVEQQKRDLLAFSEENARLLDNAKGMQQSESRRRANEQARIEADRSYEERVKQDTRQSVYTRRTIEQNNALAQELDRRKLDEERQARELQRICAESDELKQLEQQLKLAYINKERAAQQQERLLLQRLELERDQAIEDKMEFDRQQSLLVCSSFVLSIGISPGTNNGLLNDFIFSFTSNAILISLALHPLLMSHLHHRLTRRGQLRLESSLRGKESSFSTNWKRRLKSQRKHNDKPSKTSEWLRR